MPTYIYIYIISGLCLSVCVFAIHAKTAGPITTKLGGKLEEHLGRNLGLLPMTSLTGSDVTGHGTRAKPGILLVHCIKKEQEEELMLMPTAA